MQPVLLHGDGLWTIGLIGSTVTAVTFLAIAAVLATQLTRSRQWGTNVLSTGTFLIFFTCGGGHLVHSVQLVAPALGWGLAGEAARVHYGDWHLWVADGAMALAGTLYWLLRRRLPGVVRGAAVYDDLRARHQEAAFVHDGIVQALSKARLAVECGDPEQARRHLAAAEAAGQQVQQAAEDSGRLLEAA